VFRPSRERRGEDPWLPHRTLLFVAGAAAGMAGMALNLEWLVTAAIVLLGAGVAAGLLLRRVREDRDVE